MDKRHFRRNEDFTVHKGFDVLRRRSLLDRAGSTKVADRERDSGNWAAAAAHYAEFLASAGRNSRTFGYIVQLGNCLKEAGRYDEALAAYDDAVKINGRNADLHLQRGHLYKLMGNSPAAAWAYQQAHNLDPANEHVRHEIEASGAAVVAGVDLPEDLATLHTIWFDVTDFIDYARHNVSLSGIQRVCGNLMLSVEVLKLKGYRVVPVLPEYDTGRFLAVRYGSFVKLVRLFQDDHVRHDDILSAVAAIESERSMVTPAAGDIFVIAGAFWIISRYDKVAELRRHGMKFGLFIHDLIQIRNKDYVMPDAVDRFNIQLSDALELCDFVLTNSGYVRDDVQTYLRESKHLDLPVKDVLLPTELSFARSSKPDMDFNDPKLTFVLEQDYVLVVSTIEVRKNHELLIRVWEELRKELGEKTPYLVFVGKWGWQIDRLHAHLDEQGYEGDWLFIFNGISDVMMEALYKRALFTVYPSFAEGFGLPIGESLAYGKPCIASNTTAMPEVGGDFVRYFDPFDWQSALPVIRRAVVDRDDLRQWQNRIATEFRPKRWSDFCEEFYRSVIECANAADDSHALPLIRLPARQLISGGDYDILTAAVEQRPILTFRAARTRNWHAAESWGVWSSDRRSEIAFHSDFTEGERVYLFLGLERPNAGDGNPIVVADCGDGESHITLTSHPSFYRFTGVVRAGGEIRIQLLARGKFTQPDSGTRPIFIGWSGLAYCRADNDQELAETLSRLIPSASSVQ